MQLLTVISTDSYRARGFVSFAFSSKPRSTAEELPKDEDCQGVRLGSLGNRIDSPGEGGVCLEDGGLRTED